MSSVSLADARKDLAEIVNRTTYNKERTILTKRGKQVAVIMPVEDLELLESLEDQKNEHENWLSLSGQKLEQAYGKNEPEYPSTLITKVNSDYE